MAFEYVLKALAKEMGFWLLLVPSVLLTVATVLVCILVIGCGSSHQLQLQDWDASMEVQEERVGMHGRADFGLVQVQASPSWFPEDGRLKVCVSVEGLTYFSACFECTEAEGCQEPTFRLGPPEEDVLESYPVHHHHEELDD